jgi:hypothetical protein
MGSGLSKDLLFSRRTCPKGADDVYKVDRQKNDARIRGSEKFCWDIQGIESSQRLSVGIRLSLPSAFMMKDLPVLLEGVVVERRFLAEAVNPAIPHDFSVCGPVRGEPQRSEPSGLMAKISKLTSSTRREKGYGFRRETSPASCHIRRSVRASSDLRD